MKAYRTIISANLEDYIEEIEVEKFTKCYVVLKSGYRESRVSYYYCYFKTKKEAKTYVIKELDRKAEGHESSAEYHQKEALKWREKLELYRRSK
jgi:hypothetical protein